MPSRCSGPSLGQAAALGALHGVAELLPVSSSAHVAIVPWLLGWDYGRADGELRKGFEVAVHAGTAAALLITLRRSALRRPDLIAPSLSPPVVVGYTLERPIERRLGMPSTIAAGLLAGSVAMVIADRAPELRHHDQAGTLDGLCLGVAQACALVPGVSRSGATLAAARFRRFTRTDAERLSNDVAFPVILAATVRKSVALSRRGIASGERAPLAVGALASFGATLGSTRLIRRLDGSLLPFALYRAVLAAALLLRLERTHSSRSGR
jgi:undecaprenyl-diphosphatase